MKNNVLAVILLILLLENANPVGQYKNTSFIQHINTDKTPVKTMQDIIDLLQAFQRKDYVLVVIRAIDVYVDLQDNKGSLFIKWIIRPFESVLYKVHGFYLRVFPCKRPKNESTTLDIIKQTLDNPYIQATANTYSKLETPLINGVIKLLF